MENTVAAKKTNKVLQEDMENIFQNLSAAEKDKLRNSTVLITGCGGFLGYYFMHFFAAFAEELQLKKVIALENFLTGTKDWLDDLIGSNPEVFSLHEFNVITDDVADISGAAEADVVLHLASIASPTFYRIYPIETVDANITGLRRLLDFYAEKSVKAFLFFSSSEIYGDPFPEFIPTKEDYRGNVATIGPRACYDEAKRFGETLCYLFAQKHKMPIGVARPFNNYGPGMNINDKRLPADFAKAIVEGRDLEIFSDGTPTRTFCYISDAITGYLKVMLHGKFDVFNIGMDKPELSVREFAEIFNRKGNEIWGYSGQITFQEPEDKEYLTHNPNRRCPDISKAKQLLDYNPSVHVEDGIARFLEFLHINRGKLV
ncbi:NAD-dependent epimerase/dehydratase family protein [Pontibacter silvestris]|uniref:NAD-dependent epimerase/dehydratase family protein n=1 Tax=Pontibacter silvestris TaxID=2305183 RepID=A0ABW4X1W0_9BACT|nr:NAD-dependent epimerase/dehydratase family protein [Pontibacter silvestris]MCC9135032.1 NAD-dependent epimerase/dehydratase family protein [Pontibacter silvestris]